MSSNPTKSQAINAETTKNPKEGSDWLGGPQNGSEIPGNGGNGGNGGNASGSGDGGNGAVTQANSSSTQSLFDTVHQIQMIAGGPLATDARSAVGNSLQEIFMGCRAIYIGCSSSTLSLNDGVGQIQNIAFPLNDLPDVISSKDATGGVEMITGACNDIWQILGGGPSGQSWIGGPQNQNETPREAARNPQTGDIQKPTEGVDTQTGSQAKGMGSDGYTKHRF